MGYKREKSNEDNYKGLLSDSKGGLAIFYLVMGSVVAVATRHDIMAENNGHLDARTFVFRTALIIAAVGVFERLGNYIDKR